LGDGARPPHPESQIIQLELGNLEKFQREERKDGDEKSQAQPENKIYALRFFLGVREPYGHMSSNSKFSIGDHKRFFWKIISGI